MRWPALGRWRRHCWWNWRHRAQGWPPATSRNSQWPELRRSWTPEPKKTRRSCPTPWRRPPTGVVGRPITNDSTSSVVNSHTVDRGADTDRKRGQQCCRCFIDKPMVVSRTENVMHQNKDSFCSKEALNFQAVSLGSFSAVLLFQLFVFHRFRPSCSDCYSKIFDDISFSPQLCCSFRLTNTIIRITENYRL